MVFESDFSRRQFLNSCAQSGMFYSSPNYKPSGYLSVIRSPSTTVATPLTTSRSERTAKLIASLSTNAQPNLSLTTKSQYRQPFDPERPYCSSEAEGISNDGNDAYGIQSFPTSNHNQRTCCACCKNCGTGIRLVPSDRMFPAGAANLRTQDSMESYLKSRRPILGQDETLLLPPKQTYSVRNIPVRSLNELRETVAIRRNYIKERQQRIDGSNGSLSLAYLEDQRSENSVSPQPDGSIVSYPSVKKEEKKIESGISYGENGGGSYREVDES